MEDAETSDCLEDSNENTDLSLCRTGETTSLLMKELDEIQGVAGAIAHDIPSSGHSSTSGRQRASTSTFSGDEDQPQTTHIKPSLLQKSTEPHNVARAILQAIRRHKKSPKTLVIGGGKKRLQNPTPVPDTFGQPDSVITNCNVGATVNGHATEDEILSAACRSPLSTNQSRLKQRLKLELRPHLFPGPRNIGRYTGKTGKEFARNRSADDSCVNKGDHNKDSYTQAHSAPENCDDCAFTDEKSARDSEHGLIAFHSALLQVNPNKMMSSADAVISNPKETRSPQLRYSFSAENRKSTTNSSPSPGPSSVENEPVISSGSRYSQTRSNRNSVGNMHGSPGGHIVNRLLNKECGNSTDDEGTEHTLTVGEPATMKRRPRRSVEEIPSGVAVPTFCVASTPGTESFLDFRSRFCTSYRLKGATLKNPVDVCLMPNECLAVADYDNGFLLLNPNGDIIQHHSPLAEGKNACGVACCAADGEFRLLVLAYKEGAWSINVYNWTFELKESIVCPHDSQIETWALRKIVLGESLLLHAAPISADEPGTSNPATPISTPAVYLMASGESKTVIWARDLVPGGQWEMMVSENSRRGAYNDISIKFDHLRGENRFLLCDWKKSQLSLVVLNTDMQLMDSQTIKMKRVKGQEWIVQGPKLAVWDENSDILVYDGSGKLFLFDGETFKCKKIVADLGKGEVSALTVRDGWCYALCRYRLCLEVFLYKQFTETTL